MNTAGCGPFILAEKAYPFDATVDAMPRPAADKAKFLLAQVV